MLSAGASINRETVRVMLHYNLKMRKRNEFQGAHQQPKSTAFSNLRGNVAAHWSNRLGANQFSMPLRPRDRVMWSIEVLKCLRAMMIRIRPELAENGWILHQGKASSHLVSIVREFLACNLFLFHKMKRNLFPVLGDDNIHTTAVRVI